MELDFNTVKALSSPTRVRILGEVLESESTPTDLSNELDKSKSTVSSHLKKLTEAGLLDKDEEEGRKRVVYRPTDKSKAIVEGRERKVRFSIASSIVTTVAAVGFIGYGLVKPGLEAAGGYKSGGQEAMNAMAQEAPQAGAEVAETGSQMFTPANAFLFLGVGFLSLSAFSFLYGMMMKRLG